VHCITGGERTQKYGHWSVKIGIIQYKCLGHFEQYFRPLCNKEEFFVLPETQYSNTMTELSEIFEDCEHWTSAYHRAMPFVLLVYVTFWPAYHYPV